MYALPGQWTWWCLPLAEDLELSLCIYYLPNRPLKASARGPSLTSDCICGGENNRHNGKSHRGGQNVKRWCDGTPIFLFQLAKGSKYTTARGDPSVGVEK